MKNPTVTLSNLVIQIPELSWLKEIENMISKTLANVLFSQDVRLGRWVALVMLVMAPETFLFGIFGICLCHYSSHLLSQNRVLNSVKVFEMNGWFLGLALSTFKLLPLVKVGALIGLSPLCTLVVIVTERLLKAWDIPAVVLPYCVVFWFFQSLGLINPSLYPGLPITSVSLTGTPLLDLLAGSARGFGQIFFSDDIVFSSIMITVLFLYSWRRGCALFLGSIIPATLCCLIFGNSVLIGSGLTSFSGILLTQAYLMQPEKYHRAQFLVLVLISGLVEMVSLRIASNLSVYALSLSYVVCLWVGKLGVEASSVQNQDSNPLMTW